MEFFPPCTAMAAAASEGNPMIVPLLTTVRLPLIAA